MSQPQQNFSGRYYITSWTMVCGWRATGTLGVRRGHRHMVQALLRRAIMRACMQQHQLSFSFYDPTKQLHQSSLSPSTAEATRFSFGPSLCSSLKHCFDDLPHQHEAELNAFKTKRKEKLLAVKEANKKETAHHADLLAMRIAPCLR